MVILLVSCIVGLLAALAVTHILRRATGPTAHFVDGGRKTALQAPPTRPRAQSFAEEDRHAALVHKAKDAILTTDAKGTIDFLNRSARTMFGYDADEAIGMSLDVLLPRRASELSDADPRSSTVRAETVGRRRNGDEFPVELSLSTWESAGRVVSSVIARDATERHRAEASLRQSESNFRRLIEQLPLGVVLHREGRLVYVNAATRRLLGREPEAIIGLQLDQIFAALPAEAALRSTGSPRPQDSELLRADGTRNPVHATSVPIVFDGVAATVLVIKDISEERALDAQMIFADRLASMGRLAAGVAHEVNNPLASVLSNLAYLREDFSEMRNDGSAMCARTQEWQNILVDMAEGLTRVRHIVRDLKVLSRPDDVEATRLNLSGVVSTSLRLASTELRARARVETNVDDGLFVMANEPRLVQVLLNLLVNAAQAMPKRDLEANLVTLDATASDDAAWITLSVRDNGCGMSAETQKRIFTPFFTTKPVGVGTGLGLSISLDIVRSFGGHLEVDSRVGAGSDFRVRLPAAKRNP